MRYAIFTDIHANLEALEAVLATIDEIAQHDPVDQIWFLGDLVGYGPNPNECIEKLRDRTDVIIAGNHDWAAVGKIDLEDFSEAARLSAEWTAGQLTDEHKMFLANLPERLEIDDCLLVHGSPFGPLWEYLTSDVLAERSFQYFQNRFCFVGHTHVPVIFQQLDTLANSPTIPLEIGDNNKDAQEDAVTAGNDTNEPVRYSLEESFAGQETVEVADDEKLEQVESRERDTPAKLAAVRTSIQAATQESVYVEPEMLQEVVAEAADVVAEVQYQMADDLPNADIAQETVPELANGQISSPNGEKPEQAEPVPPPVPLDEDERDIAPTEVTPEETIASAEERLNEEIEELLTLLGISQSMIKVTNEMLLPPEGDWQAPDGYRAIINPGGVGQPRDGDARAAFMIYDTEHGFTFYRIPYSFEKTQEKIIQAKLPPYLATRLAYGR